MMLLSLHEINYTPVHVHMHVHMHMCTCVHVFPVSACTSRCFLVRAINHGVHAVITERWATCVQGIIGHTYMCTCTYTHLLRSSHKRWMP